MASAADETKRLLRIARRRSDDARRELLAICGDLLGAEGGTLTSLEYALMRDILRRLVESLAAPLRAALGERIKLLLPERTEVALRLGEEPIELTAPLLLGGESACSLQLVEIVRDRAFEHRLTLAMRRSPTDLGDPGLLPGQDAIDALLRLPDPAIPDLVMAYLVDQSRRFDRFLEPVVRAEDLPAELRRKLMVWLLAGMRHHVQREYGIDGTALDDAIEAVARIAMPVSSGPQGSAAVALAHHLDGTRALTGPLMLQVLRQGEVALFAAMLAELAGLRIDLVRRLVFETCGEGLAIICRATDLGRPVLASIFLLTRRARPSERAPGPAELSKVVALYDMTDPKVARAVLARWRRDRDFLTALRFIEEAASGPGLDPWAPFPAILGATRTGDANLAPIV